jgi:hypothetical protein
MRKKVLALTSTSVPVLAVAVFGGVTPAAAHGDHTSCAGGVVGVIESGEFPGLESGPGRGIDGGVASFLATSGLAPEIVLGAHVGYCEPKS